jgi:hypothetical protein
MAKDNPKFVFEVGQPYPGIVQGQGLLTFMGASEGDDNGVEAMFVASLPGALPVEVEALISKPIRFGIVQFNPIIFILLLADGPTVLDSPFGIGLYRHETAIELLEASRHARGWPAITRRITKLVVVDPETMLIKGLREMTLTRDWWITLADELERCPLSLSRENYKTAMQQAYSRWKTTAEMIPHCVVIEETGI